MRWRAGAGASATAGADGLTVDRGRSTPSCSSSARRPGRTVLTRGGRAGRSAATAAGGCRSTTARVAARASCWPMPAGGGGCSAGGGGGPRRATLALHASWRAEPPAATARRRGSRRSPTAGCGARTCPAARSARWRSSIPQALRGRGRDRERLYRRLLLGHRRAVRRPGGAGALVGSRCRPATRRATPPSTPIDERWRRRSARPPSRSTRCPRRACRRAIQTGLAGAAAVHTILAPDGDRAARRSRSTATTSATRSSVTPRTAAGVYAEHRSHGEARVLAPRALRGQQASAGSPDGARARATARRACSRGRSGLRQPPRCADTPCLVGDRIELRRALTHPGLERPVAFLGGSELAPLLDDLPRPVAAGRRPRLGAAAAARSRARDRALAAHTGADRGCAVAATSTVPSTRRRSVSGDAASRASSDRAMLGCRDPVARARARREPRARRRCSCAAGWAIPRRRGHGSRRTSATTRRVSPGSTEACALVAPPRCGAAADHRPRRLRRRRGQLDRDPRRRACARSAPTSTGFCPAAPRTATACRPRRSQRLAQRGTRLLITADCAITAVDEVAAARAAGLDVVVTDHHSPRADGALPDAPIVHPAVCGYPCAGPVRRRRRVQARGRAARRGRPRSRGRRRRPRPRRAGHRRRLRPAARREPPPRPRGPARARRDRAPGAARADARRDARTPRGSTPAPSASAWRRASTPPAAWSAPTPASSCC